MPDTNPPILFLVAGAWHGSWMFDSIVDSLTKGGFKTSTIELPSTRKRGSLPLDKKHDVEHIRREILKEIEKGRKVAIVCHSYAGVPTCDAVKGLGISERKRRQEVGGVCGLIFVAAFVLRSGMSVQDMSSHQQQEFHYEDGFVWPATPKSMFYNDLPCKLADELSSLIQPHSIQTFSCTLDHEAYQLIPSSYLMCTNDQAIPLTAQEEMLADKTKYFDLIERIDSGHSPFISHPQETVDFINKALQRVKI